MATELPSDLSGIISKKSHLCFNELDSFLKSSNLKTESKSKYSNIISQGEACYAFPSSVGLKSGEKCTATSLALTTTLEPIDKLFELLERCRMAGVQLHFCEKQSYSVSYRVDEPVNIDSSMFSDYHEISEPSDDPFEFISTSPISSMDTEVEASCIEFDFDTLTKTRVSVDDHWYANLVAQMTSTLHGLLDWQSMPVEYSNNRIKMSYHVVVLGKDIREYESGWKLSFHIRIFLKATKEFKSYFRFKLLESGSFTGTLCDLGLLAEVDKVLDSGAISGPAMLLGSSKLKSNNPHQFKMLFRIDYDSTMHFCFPKKCSDFDLIHSEDKIGARIVHSAAHKFNLVYETSLNFEAPKGLIKKPTLVPRPDIVSEMTARHQRIEDSFISEALMREYEDDLTNLTVSDFNAHYLSKVLEIIAKTRVTEYEPWKTIVIALARASQNYKPLAIMFSMRCPCKFVNGAIGQINGLFDYVKRHPVQPGGKEITVNTLYYWARQDDPSQFEKIQSFNTFMDLQKRIFEVDGGLKDMHIARTLHSMFGSKFICDESRTTLAKTLNNRIWREFIFPEDDHQAGTVYKWCQSAFPDSLARYVTDKFPVYLNVIIEFCKKSMDDIKRNADKTDEIRKQETDYFNRVVKNIRHVQGYCNSVSGFKNVITASAILFRTGKRGWEARMDNNDEVADYIGVMNGVLQLRPHVELIQKYHEIPISKYVSADYVPYDPEDMHVRDLEKAMIEIFEDDLETYQFFMMMFARALDGHRNSPQYFVQLHGGGAQGKSFITMMLTNLLKKTTTGNGYASTMDVTWFCAQRKVGPDTTLCTTKNARICITNEAEDEMYLQMARIKTMLSDAISADDKNEKADSWEFPGDIYASTNHPFKISNIDDWGTWRRIIYYRCKRWFMDPTKFNPEDPSHRLGDVKIGTQWVKDPLYLRAFLSILVHYYQKLHSEFNGKIENIPRRIIIAETEAYQASQNTVLEFIMTRLIHIGTKYVGTDVDVPDINLTQVVGFYTAWYNAKYSSGNNVIAKKSIRECFKNSKIKGFIKSVDGEDILSEYRVLENNESRDSVIKKISFSNDDYDQLAAELDF